MSNSVGYVLLGSSVVPALLGWQLSNKGLDKVHEAADAVKKTASAARAVVASAQTTVAGATGADAQAVAAKSAEIVEKTDSLSDGVDQVNEALKGMTGVFAPARVFLAVAFLLILAALVALDVMTIGAGA
jgi:hypothetical protein